MEINLVPKFLDEAVTPVAQSVGNTISSVWSMVFGGIDFYAQKVHHKRVLNLNIFKEELEQKVSNIPSEKLVEPPLHVIGPALEASKYYFENSELRAMFANLIASSVNSDFANQSHPSFVEIIKQLNSDEARILSILDRDFPIPVLEVRSMNQENDYFNRVISDFSMLPFQANCEYPNLGPSYLQNISRLGLADIDYSIYVPRPNAYDDLINHRLVKDWEIQINKLGKRMNLKQGSFVLTDYGYYFYETCIRNK